MKTNPTATIALLLLLMIPLTAESLPTGMRPAAANDSLKLYINDDTAEIAVSDTRGRIWYSNPPSRTDDAIASSLNRARLNSQAVISMYTPRDQLLVFSTWDNSVSRGQFEINPIPDGIEVTYFLDNHERDETDIPLAVFKERFESRFLAQMSPEEQELFLSRYRYDDSQGVYYRFGIPRFLLEEFFNVLDRIGYSRLELKEDAPAAELFLTEQEKSIQARIPGLRATENRRDEDVSVTLTIQYRLEGKNLTVTIPSDRLMFNPAYPIHTITPLEFFAAAGRDEEGYIFVPDGSGALIKLNNGKHRFPAFSMMVYNQRQLEVKKENLVESRDINMPVFGMSSSSNGFFGIIESGAPAAGIEADIAGRLSTFNHVNAKFRYLEKGKITIGSGDKARSKLIFEQNPAQTPMSIRYYLLDPDAGYMEMAVLYREYLIEQGILAKRLTEENPELQLELIGAVENQRRFMGFSWPETLILTDYTQAARIVDALLGRGVKNMAVRFKGWMQGGIAHRYPKNIIAESELGGRTGLRKLNQYLATFGIDLYPELAVLEVHNQKGGFSPRGDAARYLNQSPMRGFRYDPATFQREQDAPGWYYLAPEKLSAIENGISRFGSMEQIPGIHFTDLASLVYGDYDDANPVSAAHMMDLVSGVLEELAQKSVIRTDSFMAPYLGSIDYIQNLPMDDSNNNLADTDIPFNALVLHGYKRYAGESVNLAADERRSFLKNIETGADLSFTWTYADTARFKETIFNNYYSTRFDSWLDTAVRYFQDLQFVHQGLTGKVITGHEILDDGIVRVRYEGGTIIYINYTTDSTRIDGRVLPAEGFLVEKESAQ